MHGLRGPLGDAAGRRGPRRPSPTPARRPAGRAGPGAVAAGDRPGPRPRPDLDASPAARPPCCARASYDVLALRLLRLRPGWPTRPGSTRRPGRPTWPGSMRCPSRALRRLGRGARRALRGGLRRRAHHRRDRPGGAAGARGGGLRGARRRHRGRHPAPSDARADSESAGTAFVVTSRWPNVCVWSPSGSVVASSGAPASEWRPGRQADASRRRNGPRKTVAPALVPERPADHGAA